VRSTNSGYDEDIQEVDLTCNIFESEMWRSDGNEGGGNYVAGNDRRHSSMLYFLLLFAVVGYGFLRVIISISKLSL